MGVRFRVWTAIFLVLGAATGCSGTTSAIIETMQAAVRGNAGASNSPLNPNFRYLRVTVDGRSALLVLGYTEPDPQGTVEVWYSAEREVIRLQNGRVVGAVGLTTEWRNVTVAAAPSWASMQRVTGPVRFARSRDTMPGYRYGIKESLSLVAVSPPKRSALQNIDPRALAWFEEIVEPGLADSALPRESDGNRLPNARYAIAYEDGKPEVVYGEQCLASDLCFAWQRWPAAAREVKVNR